LDENGNLKESINLSQSISTSTNNNINNNNTTINKIDEEMEDNEQQQQQQQLLFKELDPLANPSWRLLEEVGKKKFISAEPSRRPGIKTPLFSNISTLANPPQFHQIPPEKLSSNLFTTPVQENSYPDNSLLFNQQIINRVANDKELSYLFFPVLKSTKEISNCKNSNSNSNNSSQAIVAGAGGKGNHHHNHHGKPLSPNLSNGSNPSSCDSFSLSMSPSPCSSLSPSPSPSPPLLLDSMSPLISPPTLFNNIINVKDKDKEKEKEKENSRGEGKDNVTTPVASNIKDSRPRSYWALKSSTKSTPQSQSTGVITNSITISTSPPQQQTQSTQQLSTSSSPIDSNLFDQSMSLSSSNRPSSPTTVVENTSGTSPPSITTTTTTTTTNSNVETLSTIIQEEFSNRTDIILCPTSIQKNRIKVKSATLDALIELLTHHRISQPDFIETFLLTYKSFVSPLVVLDKLIEKYEYDPFDDQPPTTTNESNIQNNNNNNSEEIEMKIKNSRTVKLRVVSIIKCWVDKHFYDFEKNPHVLEAIIAFLEGPVFEDGMEKVSNNILKLIDRRKSGNDKEKNVLHSKFPNPILPILKTDQILTFYHFDDLEVARQLTLIEHESYSLIKPNECVNQSFSKSGKEENSVNIVNIIKRSNSLPLWVATEIVQEERLGKRANIIKKFISIADHCRNLNNYNAVMEILSGLNLTPVFRLKKTWEQLPRKYLATFKNLNSLMAPKFNFKVYRDVLHTKNPPCLPFLGVYLTDLTFIEEGSPDILDNGHINMVKRSQISGVIKEILQFQQLPYSFQPVPLIRDFLLQINGLQERALYKQSKIIEP